VSTAFAVVFGVFVALILGLSVVSVRWAVRRDRVARAARAAQAPPPPPDGASPVTGSAPVGTPGTGP